MHKQEEQIKTMNKHFSVLRYFVLFFSDFIFFSTDISSSNNETINGNKDGDEYYFREFNSLQKK